MNNGKIYQIFVDKTEVKKKTSSLFFDILKKVIYISENLFVIFLDHIL